MSGFTKPRKVFVDVTAYINELLADGLEKDLHDNEEICKTCMGTGIVKENNPYGLTEDPDRHSGAPFPFKHTSITFCPSCYNGIAHRCKYCGRLLPKGYLKCTCTGFKEQEESERRQKYAALLEKAQEHESDALGTTFEVLYSDDISFNEGYFSDWDHFFDAWYDECKSVSERPQYVWGTFMQGITLDADSILELACDGLHEEAYQNITDKDRRALQELLDDWCKKISGTETYYRDVRHKVKIPWEKYDARA